MTSASVFAIRLRRLRRAGDAARLISVSIADSGGKGVARRIGSLTDIALRARISHWNLHSANEVAALRKALDGEAGEATLYEGWPALANCWHFWRDFVGSQITRLEWSCDGCQSPAERQVGASVGETVPLACKCGTVGRMTVGSLIREAEASASQGQASGRPAGTPKTSPRP